MISFSHKGDYSKTTSFLKKACKTIDLMKLHMYGKEGVKRLSAATPVDTGKTASSWSYRIITNNKEVRIVWNNSNIQNGVPIAVIIQYGHATKNGGWVQGRDYIHPAIQPFFDKITNEIWKEVSKP